MNEVVKTLMDHRSIRQYTREPVDENQLLQILQAAQAAPSSINGQQISLIVIKDQQKKEKIAELSGGQPWIAQAPVFLLFVADYYRAKLAAEKNHEALVITDSLESIMVSSVDVGLAMGNAIAAAESMGLGIVPIGAVRRNPDEIVKMLQLPEFVFPIAGLVIGHPDGHSEKKPRLPMKAVVHDEVYNTETSRLIDEYDDTISAYLLKRSDGTDHRKWSEIVSGLYNKVYFPKVSPVIKEQGFKNL